MKANRKIIIAISAAVVLAGTAGAVFALTRANDQPALKQAELKSEYGKKLNLQTADLVQNPEDAEKITLDYSKVTMEKDQDYPALGTWDIDIIYKDKTLDTRSVTIEDTTKPKFTEAPDSITLQEGDEMPAVEDYFQASDLDPKLSLSWGLTNEMMNMPGYYECTVTTKDSSGNSTSHDFEVIITRGEPDAEIPEHNEVMSDPGETAAASSAQNTADDPASISSPTYIDGILIANKKYPLPAGYAPGEDPTAGAAIRQVIAAMQAAGLDISDSYSGYRSYDTQAMLYNNYCASSGQAAADTFSARPGYSEHQTGLAFDLKHTDGSLVERQAEADWILQHCAEYGFIVRYQPGQEAITGYMAEPWHLRYVGSQAADIMNSGLTLEEYLGAEGGDYRN